MRVFKNCWVAAMVICTPPMRRKLRVEMARLALGSPYRSAVRELPDERTIEHGCHCDEHEANDEPGPRLGFAVLFACVHDRPSIVKWPRRVHTSAAEIGRTRVLTPRVRRAVPSWRLSAGETRATRPQMARAAYLVHPLIRGALVGPSRRQARKRASRAATRSPSNQSRGCAASHLIVQLDNPCSHLATGPTGAFGEDILSTPGR